MSAELEHKYGEYEGFLWYRTHKGTAYWKLCLECHNLCYPEVKRARNRSSNPPPDYFVFFLFVVFQFVGVFILFSSADED